MKNIVGGRCPHGGCFFISKELMINEEIKNREVRLIGENGETVGIIPTDQALKMAAEKNLDLVQISPKATPPVCKIMDYGKYRFEQAKREKEVRKNQKIIVIKEIRMSMAIDDHDMETKANHTIKFLKAGDKVKITVRFKGREISHSKLGEKLLIRFADLVSEYGVVEKAPKLEGRSMSMFIAPK